MKYLITIAALFATAACSVYESPGRKFLEQSGMTYPWCHVTADQTMCEYSATALVKCGNEAPTKKWELMEKNERADVYMSEGDSYDMRIVPAGDPSYSCWFRYASAEEMFQTADTSIDLTLYHLSGDSTPPKTR